MKKILLALIFLSVTLFSTTTYAQSWAFWCTDCLRSGVAAAGGIIGGTSGVITHKTLAQAVQDIIVFVLSFISVIAVIYIMYAGAHMLLNPGGEETPGKTKKIILSVIAGLVIIWFAWWMVKTILYLINTNGAEEVRANRIIREVNAETQIRQLDFSTYSHKLKGLQAKLDGAYSSDLMSEISTMIDGAYDHLPDRADKYINAQLYHKVKKAIADYSVNQADIDRGILENAIENFLEKVEVFAIDGEISATPDKGNAPLSVTLEGKNMIDSSGTIIPEDNYVWWLRQPSGIQIIGRGKTINYIFQNENNYTVYLTVNSASKNKRGNNDVINYERSINVEVEQSKLQFNILFDNQLLTGQNIKIHSLDPIKTILIDASGSKMGSGYTISRTIWDFGNGQKIEREGAPIPEPVEFKKGEYNIRLTIIRNDNEEFYKNILLKVGDPIASIGVNNAKPNKGDSVIFQAKKISQEGVNFLWEIRKGGAEHVLFSKIGSRLEYIFRESGQFTVSLTTSKGTVIDKESINVEIESRPPVVRFSAEKLSNETPNIYLFDGTLTYDPDYPDDQSLKYQWIVNDKIVQLENTNSNNSRGEFIFPEIGAYNIELHVTDGQGKTSSFKNKVTIKSLLSVRVNIRPLVAQRGEKILLTASAPNAKIYEWSIGNKDKVVTDTGRHVTQFDLTGMYSFLLKVEDQQGNINTVSRKIYVVDSEKPFAVIATSTRSLLAERQQNACGNNEALIADRVTPVSFNGEKSVNVGGKPVDLKYFWKIGNNYTSPESNFIYTFDELGCVEVTLTVDDKKTGAQHTSKEWVKVVNIPPRFSDIDIKIDNIDQDPMRVTLKAMGAKDVDGVIRSYTWYYYTNYDEQPIGFRVTTQPETVFTLPKINGRYIFAVILEDSNEMKVDTKIVSEDKYSTPDLFVNQNISTPIIEFKSDTNNVQFGDKVNFTVNARNALGQDLSKSVEYRWDVDGDGFYDIKTANNTMSYQYTHPQTYYPKIKVSHRGFSATKSIRVDVTNKIQPLAQVQVIGNKIIAYNISTGIYKGVSWYLDDVKISENKEYIYYNADTGTFPKTLRLDITDGVESKTVTISIERSPQNKVRISKVASPLVVITNEGINTGESGAVIAIAGDDVLWSDPNKPLFFYLGESTPINGRDPQFYVIDNDIEVDSDLSGGKDDDIDNKTSGSYRLGRPYSVPQGTKRITVMKFKIQNTEGVEMDSRLIRVTRTFIPEELDKAAFEGIEPVKDSQIINLTKDDKTRIDKLRDLLKNVPDESSRMNYLRHIDQLSDNWYDRRERFDTLYVLSSEINNNTSMTKELKDLISKNIGEIYIQSDEEVEQAQLTRVVLEDLLLNSKNREVILGDGTQENTGLLGTIIVEPEYFSENKKIVERMYEEYIKFDPDISPEYKKFILDRLNAYIGAPPITSEEVGTSDGVSEKKSFLQKLIQIKNLKSILIWGMILIVSLIGIIFVIGKLVNRTKKSSLGNEKVSELQGIEVKAEGNIVQNVDDGNDSNIPDWLKSGDSPFGSEDILSQEVKNTSITKNDTGTDDSVVPTINQAENGAPDWLKDTHDDSVAIETPITDTIVDNIDKVTPELTVSSNHTSTIDDNTPDWLKDAGQTDVQSNSIAKDDSIVDNVSPTISATSDDNTPDWLKDVHTNPQNQAVPEGIESSTENSAKDEDIQNKIIDTPADVISDSSENKNIVPDDSDLPDWLKGSDTDIVPESTISDKKTELFPQEKDVNNTSEVLPKIEEGTHGSPVNESGILEIEDVKKIQKKHRGTNKIHWKKDTSLDIKSRKLLKSPSTLLEEGSTGLLESGKKVAKKALKSQEGLLSQGKNLIKTKKINTKSLSSGEEKLLNPGKQLIEPPKKTGKKDNSSQAKS